MKDYFKELVERYPDLSPLEEKIKEAYQIIVDSYKEKGKLLVAGNGGNASDSDHIVGELMKGFIYRRPLSEEMKEKLKKFGDEGSIGTKLQKSLPAISLVNSSALVTAFSNDVDSDLIFAQQIYGYGQKQDIFLALSTSGNSKNILKGAVVAKAMGIKIIALTGKAGGELKKLADVNINIPLEETYQIQERQLPIYHALCLSLEQEFFEE